MKDRINLVGFVYEHDDEDWSLWLTDSISEEDQNAIMKILDKYYGEGSSVRNVYDDLINL